MQSSWIIVGNILFSTTILKDPFYSFNTNIVSLHNVGIASFFVSINLFQFGVDSRS